MGITQMALRLRTKQIDFFQIYLKVSESNALLSAILSKRYLEFFYIAGLVSFLTTKSS